MTGVFFYLLTNPETLRKLTQEVRGAYKNVQHIDVSDYHTSKRFSRRHSGYSRPRQLVYHAYLQGL
jgi:hypothetical protein